MNKKRIAMIWFWEGASAVFNQWRDGLKAAIELLENNYKIDWFLDKKLPTADYDIALVWCGVPVVELLQWLDNFKGKKALLFGAAAPPKDLETLKPFDVIFIEHKDTLQRLGKYKVKAILAFGTDTEYYCPDKTIVKDIEYFYPAAFAPYKCQEFIAMIGPDLTCVGSFQPDGATQLKACQDNKVVTIPQNLSAQEIKDFYLRSKRVIIPALLGSERTVLEAMSMDILPRVFTHNLNAMMLVQEYINSAYISPRDFILNQYSHWKYAEQIFKGLNE